MKITSGYDKKYGRISRIVLSGFALVSVMMLIVAILGKNGATSPGTLQSILFPIISLLATIWAYAATRRKARSFPYFAAAMLAFALACYGFGAPWKEVALLGGSAIVVGALCLRFGERADLTDVNDEN
ncbi:MAG: hypothetical protein ABI389_04005 [Rhodanobacter sp.]